MSDTGTTEPQHSRWRYLGWLFSHYYVVGILLAVLAVVSVVWSAVAGTEVRKWLAACWSFVPPIYFFAEFHWARATKTGEELKRVKENQDLAGKIWAGVVAVLSVLYLK